jgi:hypothetical protein
VRRTAAGKKLERTPATVTPLVGFIARQLFSEKVLREVNMAAELEAEQKLRRMARNKKAALQSSSSSSSSSSGSTPAGGEATDEAGDTCTATSKAASKPKTKPKLPPSEFSWQGESTQTLKIGDKCRVFYESLVRRNAGDAATSAGERIDLGDFVYIDQAGVRTQDRIKATTVAATDDVDGKACHIYRVIYMCEEQGKKGGTMSVHARRMLKGRETVLQEVGGSEELFLSDICETIVVAHVVRKVNVVFMPPVPQEHPTYDDKETYFYRFYADLETGAYVPGLPPPAALIPLRHLNLTTRRDVRAITDSRMRASTKSRHEPTRRRRDSSSTRSTSVTRASPRGYAPCRVRWCVCGGACACAWQ